MTKYSTVVNTRLLITAKKLKITLIAQVINWLNNLWEFYVAFKAYVKAGVWWHRNLRQEDEASVGHVARSTSKY